MSDSPAPVPIDHLLAQREWVRRLARRLAHDESEADRLEQETFMAALHRPLGHGKNLRGWLGRVLRSKAVDEIRRRERRGRREAAVAVPEAQPSAAELVSRAKAERAVADAVLSLAEPYRATILHRYYEGLSNPETARRMGVPVATVKTRVQRALARLRERLDSEHEGRRQAWIAPLLLPLAKPSIPVVLMLTTKKTAAVVAAVLLLLLLPLVLLPEESEPSPGPEGSALPLEALAEGAGPAPDPAEIDPLPATARLRVVVREQEIDRPLSGARVRLYRNAEPVAEATTDEYGTVSFSSRAPGEAGVTVTCPGWAAKSGETTLLPGEEQVLVLRLASGRSLGGRVLTVDGVPVPDAEVFAVVDPSGLGRTRPYGFPRRAETVSSGDGSFVLEGLPGDSPLVVFGLRRGFALGTAAVSVHDRSAEIRLEAGGSLEGVVRTAAGAPVAGAVVLLVSGSTGGGAEGSGPVEMRASGLVATKTSLAWGGRPSEGTAVSAEDGTYRIDGLAFGRRYAALARRPHVGAVSTPDFVATAAAPVVYRDFEFPAPGRIEVEILTAEAASAEGATLLLAWGLEEVFPSEREPGRFVLEPAAPGSYGLLVKVPGHQSHRRQFELRPGGLAFVSLRLLPGAAFSGVVVDEGGTPIPHAQVRLHRPDQNARSTDGPGEEATTGENGGFRMGGLAPGPYTATVNAPGFSHVLSETVTAPAEGHRFVLQRLGRVRLEVEFAGEPPEEFTVFVASLDAGTGWARPYREPGEIVLTGLPLGRSEVAVISRDRGRVVRTIDLVPGEQQDLGRLTIPAGVFLDGVVVDERGEPLAGAAVSVGERFLPDHRSVTTSGRGTFRIGPVSPDEVDLAVTPGGSPAQVFSVRPGVELRLRLLPTGTLRGRVAGDVAGITVRIERIDDGPVPRVSSLPTLHDGRFEREVPVGAYRLTLTDEAGRPVREQIVEVLAGRETEIELGGR